MRVEAHRPQITLMFNFLNSTIMPNHVKNIISISGSKESIARCSEQIFKGGKLSFNNIKPMPEELNVECGSLVYAAMDWMNAGKLRREKIEDDVAKKYGIDSNEAKSRLQVYADNVAKFGHPTWYGWRCEHWGTKWDAYDVEVLEREDTFIQFNCFTAWSTPLEVIKTLAEQYPDLTIDVDYADENLGDNRGSYGIRDGHLWAEERDYDFACEMWGYDPEEEEECDEVEAL